MSEKDHLLLGDLESLNHDCGWMSGTNDINGWGHLIFEVTETVKSETVDKGGLLYKMNVCKDQGCLAG